MVRVDCFAHQLRHLRPQTRRALDICEHNRERLRAVLGCVAKVAVKTRRAAADAKETAKGGGAAEAIG